MFNILHVILYYVQLILTSKFTYFVILVIFLVFSAHLFQEWKNEKPIKVSSNQISELAESLKGSPYVFAGKSVSGFDCSGFTWYVYDQFNHKIPRSADQQYKKGNPVKKEEARVGDLVFFSTSTKKKETAGHVGIITATNDGVIRFVHASTNEGVTEDSLPSLYFNKRFLGIRRVLPED
jgi:hypothetical protein